MQRKGLVGVFFSSRLVTLKEDVIGKINVFYRVFGKER